MHQRPRPFSPLPLLAESDGDDLFLDCATCGCSSCLSDEDAGSGSRAASTPPSFRLLRHSRHGKPSSTATRNCT